MFNGSYEDLLQIAIEEAEAGLSEGGIPIGAALFTATGSVLGRGHNRRVQDGDPSAHAETDAFRKAGRQKRYDDKMLVTTLAPCWYCSGLVRQFAIGTVVVGDALTFSGGIEWLQLSGITIIDLASDKCARMMREFIHLNPELWNEDIGIPSTDEIT
jgi:cytosine deaminase